MKLNFKARFPNGFNRTTNNFKLWRTIQRKKAMISSLIFWSSWWWLSGSHLTKRHRDIHSWSVSGSILTQTKRFWRLRQVREKRWLLPWPLSTTPSEGKKLMYSQAHRLLRRLKQERILQWGNFLNCSTSLLGTTVKLEKAERKYMKIKLSMERHSIFKEITWEKSFVETWPFSRVETLMRIMWPF